MLQLGPAPVERQRFRFGGGELAFHARHVQLGDVAGPVAALRQAQGALVGGHGFAHQRPLGVHRPQCEVGLRHLGLHQQARALQQRLARLRVEGGGVAGAREPPEQVELVRQVGAGRNQRRGCRAAGRVGARPAHRARTEPELRRPLGVGVAHQGACLRQARRRFLDAGVVGGGTLDQPVEHRVGKCLPPRAAVLRLGRAGDRPARAGFLELRGRRDGRRQFGRARWRSRPATGPPPGGGVGVSSWHQSFRGAATTGRAEAPPAKPSRWGTSPCSLSGRLPASARNAT